MELELESEVYYVRNSIERLSYVGVGVGVGGVGVGVGVGGVGVGLK